MHSCNAYNVLDLCGHFKSKPYSPAKSDHIKSFVPIFFKIFGHTKKSLSHNIKILVFYAFAHKFGSHFSKIGTSKNLRQINIVTELRECIDESLMSSTGSSPNIRNEKQNFVSGANMIGSHASHFKHLAFGVVISLKHEP